MKNTRLFFNFITVMMLVLPITAVGLKDPNYSQTPAPEGAMIESTVATGGGDSDDDEADSGDMGAISIPMTESAAPPSYTPPPPSPSQIPELQAEVLGVSTERDHTEEYFRELKAEMAMLRAAAENTPQKEELVEQFRKNREYQNIIFAVFAIALAGFVILTEIRYVKTSKLLGSKKKFRKKRVK
jgi:hypothetical protein